MKRSLLKHLILPTFMLMVSVVFIIAATQPVLADCSVTIGTGTLAVPVDGDVITCAVAGGDQVTAIGNGAEGVAATVNIEDGAIINVADDGISIDDATVTLGINATIQTSGNSNDALFANSNPSNVSQDVTLNDGANITTSGNNAEGATATSTNGVVNQTILLSGDNANITTSGSGAEGVIGLSTNGIVNQTVTLLGDSASIITSGSNADGADAASTNGTVNQTIKLSGDGANITTSGSGAEGVSARSTSGTASQNITLENNTSIISTLSEGIEVDGAGGSNPTSTIDSAGLIQGGTNSILLDDGDDFLTLRTGSDLSSPTGANLGSGTDTLTLIGNGSEDEIFLNVENVEVNATDEGWALTGTSTFDDVNINTGLFSNNGTLTVNNSVAVNAGATFGGTGTTIGDVTNNGTLAPGNGIGAQNINGNFVQGTGGALDIEVDAAGNEDLLNITGTASLDGVVNFSRDGDVPLVDGAVYTFIQTTGGVTGNFFSVNDDLLFVDFDVQTVGNDVQATARRASVMTVAQNDGESSVGTTLDQIIATGSSDDIDDILNALNDTDAASDLLASQSGIVTTTSVNAAQSAIGKVTNIIRGRISHSANTTKTPVGNTSRSSLLTNIEPAAGGDENGQCITTSMDEDASDVQPRNGDCITAPHSKRQFAPSKRAIDTYAQSTWIQGVGGFGDIDGDSTARGAEYDTYGVAAGIDAQLDGGVTLGTFVAFSDTDSDVDGLDDESTVRSYQLGIYSAKRINEKWQVSGSASGAYLDFNTTRSTVAGTANADFDGYGAFGHGEVEYVAVDKSAFKLSPYAGLRASIIHHEDYSESGAGALNLDVQSETTENLLSEVGLQYRGIYQAGNYNIAPGLRLGWAHEFLDQSAQSSANFSSAPGIIFNSQGPERNRNSALVGAEINIATLNDKLAFYTDYDGNFSSDANEHAFTMGFKFKW